MQKGVKNQVYFLRKVLHGMRQSTRELNKNHYEVVVDFVCEQSAASSAANLWKEKEGFIIFIVYVDGTLLFYEDDSAIAKIVWHFEKPFESRVDGCMKNIWRCSTGVTSKCVRLHNTPTLIRRPLKISKMEGLWSDNQVASTQAGLKFRHKRADKQQGIYCQFVGTLLRLASKFQLDIAYMVGYVSCFIQVRTDSLWRVGKHALGTWKRLSGWERSSRQREWCRFRDFCTPTRNRGNLLVNLLLKMC